MSDINLDGLTKEERAAVLKILNEYSKTGSSKTMLELEYSDWSEIPVDITTFIHEPKYLGNGLTDPDGRFTIFPFWEDKLKEIFPDNRTTRYNTLIFTGAIGLGKTTIAVICILYILYRLLCLKDPYLYYGLQPIDKITISLININLLNAKGVAMDKMNQLLLSSKWFMAHGEMRGETNLQYWPEKHIEIIPASSNNQIIGRAVYGNIADEVDFSTVTNDPEKIKEKMVSLISAIDARMKSRFLRGEYLPTLNIIVSSKNSDQSFLENYIATKKRIESTTTLIVDEPQWTVDSRKVTGKWFYVGIGNKFLANELLPMGCPESLIEEYKSKGYSLLKVPSGYYETFQDNVDKALRDIAGISTASSTKYISGVRWNEVKTDTYKNPFTQEIIEVGTGDDLQYYDFFDMTRITPQLRSRPLFIHLDMSKTGDKTGIAGVYIAGKRPKVENEDPSKEMFYRVAFNVSIKAPRGYEISFDKHRAFIRWLRQQGFRIKGVSADTFQSSQLSQQLEADGFEFKTISVDRLDTETKIQLQYAYFKNTIYDRRLIVYKDCDFLTEEVVQLERMADGHIEHEAGGTRGSKDAADAVCGALWNANLHTDEYSYEFGEDLDIFMRYTVEDEKVVNDKESFLKAFNESLGAINVTGKQNLRPSESVYYNELLGDDIIII